MTAFFRNFLAPRYAGRLSFRGTLRPLEGVTLQPMVWISRPGTYALGGWVLETEVGEVPSVPQDDSGASWRSRHRYLQRSPLGDIPCVIICDIE
jgi:trafficking protein particle complex subunit 8